MRRILSLFVVDPCGNSANLIVALVISVFWFPLFKKTRKSPISRTYSKWGDTSYLFRGWSGLHKDGPFSLTIKCIETEKGQPFCTVKKLQLQSHQDTGLVSKFPYVNTYIVRRRMAAWFLVFHYIRSECA